MCYCYLIFIADLCLCPFCYAEGCPGLCNGNGRCTLGNNGWYCVCQLGWRGTGCDTSMETACSDVKDNDGGKVTNNAQWCLLTLARHQQGLLTRHDLTIKLTTLVLENILYVHLCFPGSVALLHRWSWGMASSQAPGQQVFIKKQSTWPWGLEHSPAPGGSLRSAL